MVFFSEKTKYNYHRVGHDATELSVVDDGKSVGSCKNFGRIWSSLGEFDVASFEERVFVGLELGYFTGKAIFELPGGGDKLIFPAEFGNNFGARNVALRYCFGERTFWYGGVGGSFVRRYCKIKAKVTTTGGGELSNKPVIWKWSFFRLDVYEYQCIYLTDGWQLKTGYRLRWMPEAFELKAVLMSVLLPQRRPESLTTHHAMPSGFILCDSSEEFEA